MNHHISIKVVFATTSKVALILLKECWLFIYSPIQSLTGSIIMRHVTSILSGLERIKVAHTDCCLFDWLVLQLQASCMSVLLLTLFPRQRLLNFTCHLILAKKPSQCTIIMSVSNDH